MLGNASEEGGVLKEEPLVPLSLFYFRSSSFLSLSLLSSPFPSLFPLFALSLPLFPSLFLLLEIFSILRELLVLFIPEILGMALLILINCTFIGIKNNFFLKHEFVYSVIFSCVTSPSCLLFFFFY